VGGCLLETGLPWQRPGPPGRLTPARIRRGFRNIRQALPDLADAPKPGKPGSAARQARRTGGRPPPHELGKTVKHDQPEKETHRQKG
jgi:hypothetical protein